MNPNIEAELRYSLHSADQCGQILSDCLVKPYLKPGNIEERRMNTLYYDTADFILHSKGIAYRTRHDGTGWTATLKSAFDDTGLLQVKDEYDIPVAGQEPDLRVFSNTTLWNALRGICQDTLELKFIADFTRKKAILRIPAGEPETDDAADNVTMIELALDNGFIEAGRKKEYFSFLELELIEGNRDCLVIYGTKLAAKHRLIPEKRSKYSIGMAMTLTATFPSCMSPRLW